MEFLRTRSVVRSWPFLSHKFHRPKVSVKRPDCQGTVAPIPPLLRETPHLYNRVVFPLAFPTFPLQLSRQFECLYSILV